MTTVITAKKRGATYLIRARHHADGSPEVCAAVSGLLYALGGFLNTYDGEEVVVDECRIRPADVTFRFSGGEAAEAAFRMAHIGLLQIAASHPDYVKFGE